MPVYLPDTTEEVLSLLAAHPNAMLLAGGTDVMVGINHQHGLRQETSIIALRNVSELSRYTIDDTASTISLGASVTWTALEEAPFVERVRCLAEAARTVGSRQIRNAGTIGGNIATASPAGDGVCALVALDAQLMLSSATGSRQIALTDFVTGPKRTSRADNEVITSVEVPIVKGWQSYAKIGVRNAMVISIAGVAVVLNTEHRSVSIALGSVGPVIIRATEAETALAQQIDWERCSISADDLDDGARLAATAASPITDHRSTAAYRKHAVQVLTKRLVQRGLRDLAERGPS